MNNNKLKFICIILLFNSVIGKRISELVCDEIKSLNADLPSIFSHPHLIQMVITTDQGAPFACSATLISKDFVLTSADCFSEDFVGKDNILNVTIDIFRYPEEEHLNFTQTYRAKSIVTHELYAPDPTSGLNGIALLQLDEEIPFRNTMTIFRPACLWSQTDDSSDTYQIYGHVWRDKILKPISAGISTKKCLEDEHRLALFPNYIPPHSIPTMMCTNTTHDLMLTSPLEINIRNQTYVYGIIHKKWKEAARRPEKIFYAYSLKVSHYIEWIESIVWPDVHETQKPTEKKSDKECGQRKINHRPLMTYAHLSFHGEFPWHIALYRNNREYICGGTILNNRTVLTAAHCVYDERGVFPLPPNRLTVLAGTHKLIEYPIEAEIYTVKEIIVHENYSRAYLENDIAVLKLKFLIEFSDYIQPICLTDTLEHNYLTMGAVAGWGKDEHNRQSDILLQATLPVIDNFQCRAINRDFFPTYLNDHNYCAGYDNRTSICSGVSGGGMFVEYESHWYLRGIVSLGVAIPNSNRCDITQLILFTNVPKFYNWINTVN